MKLNNIKLPFTKKSALLVCFFACMFVFASFTREDREKVRAFKKEWMSKLIHKKADLTEENSEVNTVTKDDDKALGKNPAEKTGSSLHSLSENENKISFEIGKVTRANISSYPSREKEGTIGTFTEEENDRIADNFFTIDVPAVDKNAVAYLEYDLFGLASHQSVPRSINKNFAMGGEIIVPNAEWSHQKETISSSLIKNGINTILFTSPADGVKYKIKNLKIVFDQDKKAADNLMVSSLLSDNKLYVKGNNILAKDVHINNEHVTVKNGEFEKIIPLSETDKAKGVFSVTADGITNSYKISGETKSFKISDQNYFDAKGISITKDNELSIDYEGMSVKVEKETSESAYLEIVKLRAKDFPATSQGVKNVTVNNAAFRVSVLSGKLDKKVKLTIPYDEKRLGLVSPKEIKVFHFDYSKKQWVIDESATVDTKAKTVTVEGSGDNDYMNGIISVPETPQTNAHSPTSISGLKAGDPTAGLKFIAPPTASQKGDANLSYPIEIPAGRNGLQPNLSITYSSGKGNGWMGEGWDISGVSTIELDTRWGAPSFDPAKESELYSLDGEMLVYEDNYMPQRHNDGSGGITTAMPDRNAGGVKAFFLRKNHDFSKIERYGNSPANYRWVITSTSGIKTYYGGDEMNLDAQSVLKTASGEICKWGIYKVEDPYKNNIKYYYDNSSLPSQSTENANLSGGRIFSIKSIYYTGKDGNDGGYSIVFDKETSIARKDLYINAKQGVKYVEPYRLKVIKIFDNLGNSTVQHFRSYHFFYTEGEFNKSLMNKFFVAEADHYYNTYNFDYHNELKNGGSPLPAFGPDTSISTFQADSSLFTLPAGHNPAKINTTYTKEEGVTFRLGIFLDFVTTTQNPYGNIILLSLINSTAKAKAKGAQQLVDFNGDGVPDILYKKDNGLYIRPGIISDAGVVTGFGIERMVQNLKSNFSYTETKTKSRGKDWGGSISFLNWSIFANTSNISSSSKSTTPTYLVDANSDGIMDVVDGKEVWFNKIDNGTPGFTKFSEQTENMVIKANPVAPVTMEMLPKDDVIKVWVAPKDGYVRFYDKISIENVNGAYAVYSVEVPKNVNNLYDRTYRVYLTKLVAGGSEQTINVRKFDDYFTQIQGMLPLNNQHDHLGLNSPERLYVKSGQKIYVRLHQNEDDNFKVNSNPEIVYVDSTTGADIPNNVYEEQDGFNANNGNYSANFMLNNHDAGLKLSQSGNITVNVPALHFDRLNDEVKIRIVVQSLANSQITQLYSQTYTQTSSQVNTAPFAATASISEPSVLICYVESLSHIDYKNSNLNNITVNYVTGGSSYTLNLVPRYNSYYITDLKPKINIADYAQLTPAEPKTFGVQFNKNIPLSQFNPNTDFSFVYVIKKGGLIIGKRKIFFTKLNNVMTIHEVDVATNQTINGVQPVYFFTGLVPSEMGPERISIQVYFENSRDAYYYRVYRNLFQNKVFNIYYDQTTLLTSVPETSQNSAAFNPVSKIYKNWGQFLYRDEYIPSDLGIYSCIWNGTCDEYGVLIGDLPDPETYINTANCNNITNSNDMQACVAQNSSMTLPDNVFPLTTLKLGEVEKWKGISPEQYSSALAFKDDEYSTGVLNPMGFDVDPANIDNITVITPDSDMTRMKAADKVYMSSSKTHTYSGGASGNIGVGASMGYSESSLIKPPGSILLQDFMDLNGDGYPDLVTKEKVQLTYATGGHKAQQNSFVDDYITRSNNYQNAITLSANFNAKAFKDTGANAKTGQGRTTTAQADNSTAWSAPVGISGTYNFDSKDYGEAYWMDINGDGLIDKISEASSSGFNCSLNYGRGLFGATGYQNSATYSSYPIGSAGISFGTALTGVINALAGLSMGFGVDISAGGSRSTGTSEKVLEDVNGDGLVDILTVDSGALNVKYNLGNKFSDQAVTLKKDSGQNINFSEELENFNGYGSIGGHVYIPIGPIPILPIPGMFLFNLWIKIGADLAGNIGMTMSEVKKSFKDMNGDGYSDLVRYEGNNLIVNYSRIGKTNKLKQVTNQDSQATFVIDYKFTKPDYNDPYARLVMSEVKVLNPDVFSPTYNTSTVDKDMVSKFQYESSRYDRRERAHFGFAKVTTENYNVGNAVYRKSVQNFYNKSYHIQGLLKTSELLTDADVVLSRTENFYNLYKFNTTNTQLVVVPSTEFEIFDAGGKEGRRKAVVLVDKTINTDYESGGSISNTKQMFYNGIGQLERYQYTSPTFSYNSVITYHTGLPNNIINVPKSIDAYVGTTQTNLLRHRDTLVNSNGDITQVKIRLNGSEVAVTNMGYDIYGNIKWIIYPENELEQRYRLDYVYDNIYNKYVVRTTNSFNEVSFAEYHSSFDVPTLIIDISGNKMEFAYDGLGRLIRVIGPREQLLPPTSYYGRYTIMYKYATVARTSGSNMAVYRANTLHYNQQDPENPIETISFADGLGRVIQTKKDIKMDNVEKMSVSGGVYFDVFGRMVKQYHPVSENKAPNPTDILNANNYLKLDVSSLAYFITNKYDIKDRILKFTDEDHVDTDTNYNISGNLYKTTVSVSSVGQQTESFSNAEGKIVRNRTYANGQGLSTTFNYETSGQLGSVTDPEGITTIYSYDMGGRKIRIDHPDRGNTVYVYDPAGNLIKLTTENLENDPNIGQHYIKYNYDYNRLTSVKLPELPNGGNPNDSYYKYGAVGSGNQTGKLIFKADGTGQTHYTYDELGQVVKENRYVYGYNISPMYFLTQYSYDSWNRIREIVYPDGEKVMYQYDFGGNLKSVINDNSYTYISNIEYDQYEQRRKIIYGNGTKSEFNYHYTNRRLWYHSLTTNLSNPYTLLFNTYQYDGVGNLTHLENTADVSPNEMGGIYKFDYFYDTMSRLTGARGQFRMSIVRDEVSPPVPGWSPYQVSNSTFDLSLEYNGAGGIIRKMQKHEQDLQPNMNNSYDNNYDYSDHKVMGITDVNTGLTTNFEYDYNGNVVAESTVNGANRMYWDEQDRMKAYYDDNAGVYQYYAYDDKGERTIKYGLSSGSQLYQNGTLIDPGSLSMNDYKLYPNPYVVVTSDGRYTKHYFEGSTRFASRLLDGNDIFQNMTTKSSSKNGDEKVPDSETDFKSYLEKAGLGRDISLELVNKTSGSEPGLYYLHGDLLNTAKFITDENGETVQFFLNLPFGETMAEQATGMYDNRYKFNAKELDAETGFYYYGARYYNPKWSLWYRVDPMADKYPNWSPYAYTFDNPINFTDPDGLEGIVISGQPGTHTNKAHFLANGLDRAKKALKRRHTNSEKVTWIVYNDGSNYGHSAKMIKEYKAKAKSLGINFKEVKSVGEIENYVNTKGTGNPKDREKDKITSFYYVGHAIPGTLNPGYPNDEGALDPDRLKDNAYSSGTWINCVGGCRTDVDDSWIYDDSVVDKFQRKVDSKSTVSGSSVRVQYDGGVRSDEDLVKENDGEVVTVKGKK